MFAKWSCHQRGSPLDKPTDGRERKSRRRPRVVADFPSPISQVPQRISQTSIVNALSDGHFNAAFTDRKEKCQTDYIINRFKLQFPTFHVMACDAEGVR